MNKKIATIIISAALTAAMAQNIFAEDLIENDLFADQIQEIQDTVEISEDICSLDSLEIESIEQVEVEEVVDTIDACLVEEDTVDTVFSNDGYGAEYYNYTPYKNAPYDLVYNITEDETISIYGFEYNVPYKASTRCDIIIPESINDIEVAAISTGAFSNFGYIVDNISLPDTLKVIKDGAFNHLKFYGNEIVIPEGVEVIESYAFSGLNMTTATISLPSTLKTIGDSAFAGCQFLQGDLVIPEGIDTIGNSAFLGCMNFNSITISSTARIIGTNAFAATDYDYGKNAKGFYTQYHINSITNYSNVPVPLPGLGILIWTDKNNEEILSVSNGQEAIKSDLFYIEEMDPRTIVLGQRLNLNDIFGSYFSSNDVLRYVVNDKKSAVISRNIFTPSKAGTTVTVTAQLYDKDSRSYDDAASCEITILGKPKMVSPTKFFTYPGQSISGQDYFTSTNSINADYVYWKSSNSKVVKVINEDFGQFEVVGEGSANITAYFGEKGKYGTFAVSARINVRFPKFVRSSYTVRTGEQIILSAKNVYASSNPEWGTVDEEIATVSHQLDRKGNTTGRCIVSGLSYGYTKLLLEVDNQYYECYINVIAPKINRSALKVKVNRTSTVSLSNTKIKKSDIKWFSTNESIATVDANGKIKAISEGETTIYTEAGGYRNECKVTVVK